MISLEELQVVERLAQMISRSQMLRSRTTDPQERSAEAIYIMLLGRELGLSPLASLQNINLINGKPVVSGQALLGIMRQRGLEVEVPDPAGVTDAATVRVRRPGRDWVSYSYTREMARKAELLNKPGNMWNKYPAEMLIWRAVSTASRMAASDLMLGLYTVEEIDETAQLNEDGELIGQLPAPRLTALPAPAAAPPPPDVRQLSDYPPKTAPEPAPAPGPVALRDALPTPPSAPAPQPEPESSPNGKPKSPFGPSKSTALQGCTWEPDEQIDFMNWLTDTYGCAPEGFLRAAGVQSWSAFPTAAAARIIAQRKLKAITPPEKPAAPEPEPAPLPTPVGNDLVLGPLTDDEIKRELTRTSAAGQLALVYIRRGQLDRVQSGTRQALSQRDLVAWTEGGAMLTPRGNQLADVIENYGPGTQVITVSTLRAELEREQAEIKIPF